MERILVVNTGSTSTKVALYEDGKNVCEKNLEHASADLDKYDSPLDQYGMRTEAVKDFLNEMGVGPNDISAIAARGGSYTTFESGAYEVDDKFIDMVMNSERTPGASWNSCLIAHSIAKEAGIKAYIYDAVSVDEMYEIAHISGLPQIPRKAAVHTLNTKAVAREVAKKMGKKYEEVIFVIAHLGGGCSSSAHMHGRIVDIVADDEGTFSPERPGRVPCSSLVDLCFSGEYSKKTLKKMMRGQGGIVAYLGTNSAIEVENRIAEGDTEAKVIYEAMAYQIAKDIASMAAAVNFDVDRVIMTGGIAHSKMLTGMIRDRVEKIAPVEIVPGSFEMDALANGIHRVLEGTEKAKNI